MPPVAVVHLLVVVPLAVVLREVSMEEESLAVATGALCLVVVPLAVGLGEVSMEEESLAVATGALRLVGVHLAVDLAVATGAHHLADVHLAVGLVVATIAHHLVHVLLGGMMMIRLEEAAQAGSQEAEAAQDLMGPMGVADTHILLDILETVAFLSLQVLTC
jgi:hypothetical protein